MLTSYLVEELSNILPGRISTSREVLEEHNRSLFYIRSEAAGAVCFAETEADVIALVDFSIRYKIPIIPYGGGTSVEGHTVALYGGIYLNLTRMNKILEINIEDGYVVVEPGISYNELNKQLEPFEFHFPVEAGLGASIGGMVATNASGAGAADSGSMSKNVMACNLIIYEDNSAKKVRFGTKSNKSSSGYNLTNLIVGSEGTLGVVTQIILKIRHNFACENTICMQFEDLAATVRFVIAMKREVHFRRAELLDKLQTNASLMLSALDFLQPNKNTLIIELAGNARSVQSDAEIILDFATKNFAQNLNIFRDKTSAEPIWTMRKNACLAAIKYINENKKAMATDICVPLSKFAECISNCYVHMRNLDIQAPMVAHIGDGNFHFTVLIDPNNEIEMRAATRFNELIVSEAIRLDGTCTGEHGIGVGKLKFLELEHGDCIDLMGRIKASFDPLNIFNPGKVVEVKKQPKCLASHSRVFAI